MVITYPIVHFAWEWDEAHKNKDYKKSDFYRRLLAKKFKTRLSATRSTFVLTEVRNGR